MDCSYGVRCTRFTSMKMYSVRQPMAGDRFCQFQLGNVYHIDELLPLSASAAFLSTHSEDSEGRKKEATTTFDRYKFPFLGAFHIGIPSIGRPRQKQVT